MSADESASPELSIVIPAYDEEDNLESVTREMVGTLSGFGVAHEVILVDDGSRDRTPEIADRLARELPGVRALHQANQGIGGAFRAGIRASLGRYVALWPADMPCPPEALRPYRDAVGRGTVIVGCRRQRVGYNPLMQVNAWLYPRLVRTLFGLELRDVNWICFYDGARLRATRLTQAGIPMLTEILVRLRDQGASFVEVDVDMNARTAGSASAGRVGVMARTLLGLLAFWREWRRERWTP